MQERNQREELLYLAQDGGERAQGRHVKWAVTVGGSGGWRWLNIGLKPTRLCAGSKTSAGRRRLRVIDGIKVMRRSSWQWRPREHQQVSTLSSITPFMNRSKDGGENAKKAELLNDCTNTADASRTNISRFYRLHLPPQRYFAPGYVV